jgi:general secretion pathway protein G
MKKLNQQGFTLTEIMIALAIIALIAGVVGTQVMKRLDQAKVSTAKIQMKAFESALDDYYRDNGQYPTTEQGLEALINKPATAPEPKNYDSNGYLKITSETKEVPKDPWSNDYKYDSEGPTKYKITCFGQDGAAGGESLAKDIVVSN